MTGSHRLFGPFDPPNFNWHTLTGHPNAAWITGPALELNVSFWTVTELRQSSFRRKRT